MLSEYHGISAPREFVVDFIKKDAALLVEVASGECTDTHVREMFIDTITHAMGLGH